MTELPGSGATPIANAANDANVVSLSPRFMRHLFPKVYKRFASGTLQHLPHPLCQITGFAPYLPPAGKQTVYGLNQ
jgi:hypothetical protein